MNFVKTVLNINFFIDYTFKKIYNDVYRTQFCSKNSAPNRNKYGRCAAQWCVGAEMVITIICVRAGVATGEGHVNK